MAVSRSGSLLRWDKLFGVRFLLLLENGLAYGFVYRPTPFYSSSQSSSI
jgi:hypothetical protein